MTLKTLSPPTPNCTRKLLTAPFRLALSTRDRVLATQNLCIKLIWQRLGCAQNMLVSVPLTLNYKHPQRRFKNTLRNSNFIVSKQQHPGRYRIALDILLIWTSCLLLFKFSPSYTEEHFYLWFYSISIPFSATFSLLISLGIILKH